MFIFQGSIITNFLSQNLQQYKIPVYQRNYEWSWEQCDKLFEDIVIAAKRNQLHFCGSIVFQPMAPVMGINNSIIIDGQQRLTTIYILLKALVDCANNASEKMMAEQALFNRDQFGQIQLDATSKVKLKAARNNNDQLLNLIYDKHDKLDKNCEIFRNYTHFTELIKDEQQKGTTVADIYRGISLLTVAVIQLDSNDQAQEIFERINSTGVPLTLPDKIRNFVLMTDVDQDKLYEDYWLQMENLLTRDQMNGFFMDYLNFKLDGFTRENHAYDDFKQIYLEGKYTNEKMLEEILHYVQEYHSFIYGDTKLGIDINESLNGLRQLNQTTVYLFLFHIFDDYKNGVIDQNELGKILRFLLNYGIRRLICEVGSNSLRGLYKTLYARVFNRPENKAHYYDAIVSFMSQIQSKDAVPSDKEFELALKERNLYRKNALCKYLLAAIENQGKEKIVIDNLSIEHIMPQNKNLSSDWQKMLGEDWQNVKDHYLHTLGNLTLTGYNSELGDLPFKDKKEMLETKGTHITVLYSDVKDKDVWNAQTIEARAERLSKMIMDLFPIEKPAVKIEFSDPRYKEYTVADSSNATYKYPNYYELLGERVNVDSFAYMVRSVAAKLYDQDKSIIEKMAEDLERFPLWQNPVFAYDPSAIRNPVKLKKDVDIYISTGFSAFDCISFIRSLLKKYNLDIEEDFIYSARPASSAYNQLNNLQIAREWCEKKAASGEILFNPEYSSGSYVRFTTSGLNALIPINNHKLSLWGSNNFHFYEIVESKGTLFMQLAVYCNCLTEDMSKAISHMAALVGYGPLPKGYAVFFKSNAYNYEKTDTEGDIVAALDKASDELFAFENSIKEKWSNGYHDNDG